MLLSNWEWDLPFSKKEFIAIMSLKYGYSTSFVERILNRFYADFTDKADSGIRITWTEYVFSRVIESSFSREQVMSKFFEKQKKLYVFDFLNHRGSEERFFNVFWKNFEAKRISGLNITWVEYIYHTRRTLSWEEFDSMLEEEKRKECEPLDYDSDDFLPIPAKDLVPDSRWRRRIYVDLFFDQNGIHIRPVPVLFSPASTPILSPKGIAKVQKAMSKVPEDSNPLSQLHRHLVELLKDHSFFKKN
jgi:hypothetical protein